MRCREYKELVAAHADGRLSTEELESAEQHTGQCPSCEALRHAQLAVQTVLRQRAPQRVPDALRAAIARQTVGTAAAKSPLSTRIVVIGTIAAALLMGIVPILRAPETGLIGTMAADLAAADTASPQIATANTAELRAYYRRNGFTFTDTVEDLEPFGIHLIGGSVSSVGHATTTLTVYETRGTRVLCRRFRAGDIEWPQGGQRIGNSEVFSHAGVHVALTRIGADVVCAMASTMPAEQFLATVHADHR